MATEKSTAYPQIAKGKYSPLRALVIAALKRFGDFSAGTTSGEVMAMFIEFANRIIEDVRVHPYWTGGDISYYTSVDESRPIPDLIMIDGLVAHYAAQQGSQKAQIFSPLFYRNMNQILYERRYGNGPLDALAVDKVSDTTQTVPAVPDGDSAFIEQSNE